MRIGIDVTAAIAQGGGIGRYTRELVRALAGSDHQARLRLFTANVRSAAREGQLPLGVDVTLHRAPLGEAWLYRIWHRARLPVPVQLFTGALDLFHSPDFVLPPVSGGIPTLLTVHDLSFIHFPETFTPPLLRYLNSVVPRSISRASHVLADSRATRDDLMEIWDVPEERISVLYSSVGASFLEPVSQETVDRVRKKVGVGEEPYLLTVGTIQPRKNYLMLIRAFADVAEQIPHTLLIAGGKGWLYEEILAEAGRLGIKERVRFAGFVSDADLPALYEGADLFLFPSLYEGFGIPILEAMARGTAVICSDSSSLPEVAGEAARMVSPADQAGWSSSIVGLIEDNGEREALVDAGYRQVKRFSWGKSAEQLLTLYRRLVEDD